MAEMKYITEITLDLNAKRNTAMVYAKQGDVSRYIKVYFKCDGQEITVPADHTVTLRVSKPDGYSIMSDEACEISDNRDYVIAKLPEQALAASGLGFLDFVISSETEGTVLSTANCLLRIEKRALGANIQSSDELDTLTKVFQIIEECNDNLNPVMHIDNDNENGDYILYYIDLELVRHNVFNFSQYFAEKSTTLEGYGITDAYTKAQTDAKFANKVDNSTFAQYQSEVSSALNVKTDKATTLSGYGITDAYTQTQIDSFISNLKSRIAATNVGKETAQGSVGLSKLDFVTVGDNLFNKDGKHTPNSYISSTGEITSNNTYYLSEYIKVNPSTRYYVHGYSGNDNYTKLRCVAEYDEKLTFIQRTENVASTFSTGANTTYVRIAFPPANAYMTYFGEAEYSGQKFEASIPGSVIDLSSNPRSSAFVPLGEPDGFSWKNSPVHGKIFTDRNGNYQVNYDVSANKNSIGTALYVSPGGSDSNDGSKNAPLANMSTAIENGANTIYLLPGIYKRSQTLFGASITSNMNIIGVGNGVIVAPVLSSNVSFSLCENSTTVWKGSTSFMSNVVDITNKTADGHYSKYTHCETFAEVEATEGSWTISEESGNNVAYIHTIGGVEPKTSNGILLLHSGQSTPTSLFNVTGGKLYLENLICIEGSSPLFAQKQNGSSSIEIYAKNCKFFYSRSANNDVCMLQGTSLSIFQNCEASFGLKDGFNYHSREGVIPKAVEINCIGIGNGNESDGDDQGSTIHDGGKIIRIRDICGQNYGANFADQGTDTESWNIGCVGYESKCTATDSQNANYLAYSGTRMFLDGCVGFGSKYNTNIATGTVNGKIYSRNSMECYTKAEANQRFVSSKSVAFDTNKIPLKISSSTTFGNNSSNVFITDEEVRTKITTLFIASNVTQISSGAFASCASLADVYIDNSSDAITIASDAFCSESAPNIHYKDNYSDVFNTTDYLIKSIEQIHKTTYDKSEVNALIATAEHGGTWSDVRKIVRKGLAPIRYPIGYEFNVAKGNENIVFVVRGYDTITSADSGTTQYSMIPETKKVYDTLQYDAPELAVPRFNPSENAIIFYVNSEISQGTYNFQFDGASYYFIIPGASIPQGAVVSVDITNSTVAIYQDVGASTPISGYGALTLNNGSSGAPITNQWTAIESNNNSGRVSNGSNNYAQSAIRQFLNSNAGAGSVWSPTHIFDIAPSWADNKAGFLKDMDSAFLNVVANANVICRTNNIFETGSYEADGNTYTLTDKFFILSRSELIGTTSDGTQVEYYNRINNPSETQGQINNPSNFIKRDSEGASVAYATRSSVLNSATSIYYIKSDGTISKSNGSPKNTFGICPACIIA